MKRRKSKHKNVSHALKQRARRKSYQKSKQKRKTKKQPREPTKILLPSNDRKIQKRKPIDEEDGTRDLSKFYAVEPRWNTMKRCVNWLQLMPKRKQWSTGTTQSTKSDASTVGSFCDERCANSREVACTESQTLSEIETSSEKNAMSHCQNCESYQEEPPIEGDGHRTIFRDKGPEINVNHKKHINLPPKPCTMHSKSPFVSAKQKLENEEKVEFKNQRKSDPLPTSHTQRLMNSLEQPKHKPEHQPICAQKVQEPLMQRVKEPINKQFSPNPTLLKKFPGKTTPNNCTRVEGEVQIKGNTLQ